ncbi:alpha/beta hydrolase [Rhodotorula paludigena]|uniref:alpha/beta hydrolase n=1 Tax=Rhodotorula paludigena TaxID=86838 RepID=UPI00316F403E
MSFPQDLNLDELPCQPYASPRLLKWFYCTHRVSSSLCLLPYWAIKYALSNRPRPSWSIAETLLVDFTRRVSAITDQAGVQHATRDPTEEPRRDDLKETRFEWVPGLSGELLCGAAQDDKVEPLERVGTFIWERAEDVREDYAMVNAKEAALEEEDAQAGAEYVRRYSMVDGDKGDLVGIYFHGGGYTHFSAHESAQTSMIPRRLMQYDYFAAIHAVEYRLLNSAAFPGALQDGLSVYAHLVRSGVPAHKIVLIGDSAGGNIVLALARWLRDEKKLAAPGGLLLLSPWCDPGHSFPHSTTSYVPRPNPEDYLADEPTARRLLVTSLLGDKPHSYLSSPYISPASQLGPHGAFDHFPPTFVHYGDAERLEEEIESLVRGMKRDGVQLLEVEKTKDAVHDVLMVRFWNEDVRACIYGRICGWLDQVVARAKRIDRGESPAEATRRVAELAKQKRPYHDDETAGGAQAGPSGTSGGRSAGESKAEEHGRVSKTYIREAVKDQIQEVKDLKRSTRR